MRHSKRNGPPDRWGHFSSEIAVERRFDVIFDRPDCCHQLITNYRFSGPVGKYFLLTAQHRLVSTACFQPSSDCWNGRRFVGTASTYHPEKPALRRSNTEETSQARKQGGSFG